jgi:hypothetical protein
MDGFSGLIKKFTSMELKSKGMSSYYTGRHPLKLIRNMLTERNFISKPNLGVSRLSIQPYTSLSALKHFPDPVQILFVGIYRNRLYDLVISGILKLLTENESRSPIRIL